LTHARLTGRLANVIYSLDTTATDFHAYQFKPLIKLLHSAASGILIADEVGLGKTIEAGLIWTELVSRFDFQRLLVVCPAVLCEKWQRELRSRFGVAADIVGARDLLDRLRRSSAARDTERFALIASLQGIRPSRGWSDDGDEPSGAASQLARFLDAEANEHPLVDLTIVDEAHYLRNPETMTAEAGRLLRGISEFVVLLSATPVQLRSRDLFQLVNLADPDVFDRRQAFDEVIEANAPLVRARDLVAHGRATPESLREILREAARSPLLSGSRQLAALLDEIPDQESLADPRTISETAWRIENVNLLGHVVTRTRKRDVTEWRVVREAVAEGVSMTAAERSFYEQVTGVVRDYCSRAGAHEGFLLVTPQRQMSSSMPAALRSWIQRREAAEEEFGEDFGEWEAEVDRGTGGRPHARSEVLGPLTRALAENTAKLGSYEELRSGDSKYHRLRTRLKELFARSPSDKVVLFSYFIPTLSYLRERLREDGIGVVLLHGKVESKEAAIDEFRSAPGGTVLLSSEVGSEGIDLQFSRIVVNYDLPWNPMRVEQRIGRVDRLGQKAEKINVWNLFYEDTIDARIYSRLYERLDLFQRTLGMLEPVLGEFVRDLAIDLLSERLTPKQEEDRIDQTRIALENRRAEEERAEEQAAHLVAYGDYIVNQVNAARQLGRMVEASELCRYACDFIRASYAGSELRQVESDLDFEITLSNEAKHDFDEFLRRRKLSGLSRLARSDARSVRCKFENKSVSEGHRGVEVVSQFHPLIRFVSERIGASPQALLPAVAVECQASDLTAGIEEGIYVFSVQQWSMQGVQATERLHFGAWQLEPTRRALSDEDSERLVTAAANSGRDWVHLPTDLDLTIVARTVEEKCLGNAHAAYERKRAEVEARNFDRAQIQENTLSRHYESQMQKLRNVLAVHRRRGRSGLMRATEGRIAALETRTSQRRIEIEKKRRLDHRSREICLGVVRLGKGPS
jgi:superfamily II DNA or RNA helicase